MDNRAFDPRSFIVGAVSFAAGATLVLAVTGGLAGAQAGSGPGSNRFWRENAPPASTREADSAPSSPATHLPSLSGLIKTVSPSVVYIFTTRTTRNPHDGLPLELGPFGFRGPQGEDDDGQAPQGFSQRSLGSGFIVSADGYIVTNNHVVENTSEIRVQLTDGRELPAKIIGRDPQIDLGLIKIDATNLPVVSLGDSDRLEQGDWVVAMGNPLGLDHSASIGIVSGLSRNIGIGRYDALLQTDAAINPGNSGGPLFNLKGEVMGINTAIVGGANNIGFAIPINMAKEILPDLREHGKAVRGQLGVLLRELTEDHRTALALSSREGALVERVVGGSPADRAGLRPGDVIVKLNGTTIKEVKQLQRAVAASRPGSEVTMTYVREGKQKEATAKLIEFAEQGIARVSDDERPTARTDEKLGMTVTEVTPDLAARLTLKSPGGVVISSVKRGSSAAEAGLQEGDVIREVNRKKIGSPEDFKQQAQQANGKPMLLVVERNGDDIFLVLSPKKGQTR